jgi:phosphodiesterase/alkaline phosphatase D-like protein
LITSCTVWEEQCPPAANTSYSVGDLALRGEIDAVFHSGDISYANGYMSGWDFFMDQISPIAGRMQRHSCVCGTPLTNWFHCAADR